MTAREMYLECERLYCEVGRGNPDAVIRYNAAVRKLKKLRAEEEAREWEEFVRMAEKEE